MKLYYAKGACSMAVRIIINELKLKADFEAVDLQAKKTESNKDFMQINPKGAVPTLEIKPGEVLTEVAVILQYLAESNKAVKLLPPNTDFKHYRVLEWLNFVATELHKGLSVLFKPLPEDVKQKVFIPLIKSKFAYLDKHLQNHKYLLGDEFTLPDAYLFVMLTWALHFKFDLGEWKNLARYANELKQRKSIEESLRQEGLLKTEKI